MVKRQTDTGEDVFWVLCGECHGQDLAVGLIRSRRRSVIVWCKPCDRRVTALQLDRDLEIAPKDVTGNAPH